MSRQWSVDNGDIAVGRFRITSGSPRELVGWHNADITALEAERDEFRRRLEEVVAMLEPGEMPKRTFFDFHETYMRHYSQWKLKSELHTNAVSIAEGRTE